MALNNCQIQIISCFRTFFVSHNCDFNNFSIFNITKPRTYLSIYSLHKKNVVENVQKKYQKKKRPIIITKQLMSNEDNHSLQYV